MAYDLLLKGSFNHVISWGPHLEFWIIFDTLALFSTLRHYKCDAQQIFFLLAMIASQRMAAVRSCCASWSTREMNSVWTLFFIGLCTVNWWIYSFVYNLSSCWAVLANITVQCTTNTTLCMQWRTEWQPRVFAYCGCGGTCPDTSENSPHSVI
jgi:hypothetical protein